MSNPNPFVPKGSLLEQQSHRRSRLKLMVFCVLAVSVTGLVAMLIQGCKRTPPDEGGNTSMTDTNTPSDVSTNMPPDTNATAYVPAIPTNAAYVPPTPPPQPPVVPAAGTEYIVVTGDTLSKIAKANGVSLKALEAANPGVDSKHLKVKQKLTIPAKSDATSVGATTESTSSGESVYTVKAGDTLGKIAHAHGTTVKALEMENNLTTTKINVGQKLKLPVKAEAAPSTPVEAPPTAPVNSPPTVVAPPTTPAPASTNM